MLVFFTERAPKQNWVLGENFYLAEFYDHCRLDRPCSLIGIFHLRAGQRLFPTHQKELNAYIC